MPRILIFANGHLPDPERARLLVHPGDMILCADGGTRHALALGLQPAVIIGDLDSITKEDRLTAQNGGAEIELYPHDKNETDLELAISYALEQRPSSAVIVAALGDRLDQTFGNIALLGASRLAALDIRLDDGVEEVFFCRSRSEVHGQSGDLLSLIPWGGTVEGVRTEGLKWPLNNESLYPERTRGVSNEMLGAAARVSISAGLLLVIHRRLFKS